MKKWSARLLALVLCFALVLGEGSIVSAAESVGDSSEVATEEVVEETTEEEAASEEVSEEATEEVSEEVSEDASEEVSEEATEEASEEVTEEASEEATEEVSEEASEEATEEVSEEATEETSEEEKLFPGLASTFAMDKEFVANRTELQENIDVAFGGEEGKAYVTNQILVSAKDEAEAEIFAEAFAGELINYIAGVAVIELNQEEDDVEVSVQDAVMASLDPANNLPAAWPNTIYQTFEADPAMNPSAIEYQWQHDVADTTYAWDAGYDGSGVTVAVLDTGIRIGHEDLNPVMTYCTSGDKEEMIEELIKEVLGEEIDYEFNEDDIYVGHGTHVSGIIAAEEGNGKGGAGIAPGVDLLSCNVFMGDLGAATDDIIEGIVWAVENDADIINMSLGSIVYNGLFADAVKAANDSGVAVFCAAGNDNTSSYQYPASYPGAISIAALDRGLQKSSFSCYGDKIRYAFPGVDIFSTYIGGYDETDEFVITTDAYEFMSGTSMACPVGVGVAAVALNYAEENGMMKDLTGAAKVEKLLEVMDSALVPTVTKGLGKGTVSLSKLVGATVFEATPEMPVIKEGKAGKYESETLSIEFEEQKNVILCYTMNGKTPQFKNGTTLGSTYYTTGNVISIGNQKNVTLKVMAVNPSTGLCSKVLTAKYTFAPVPRSVYPTNSMYAGIISQGGSYTIKATVYPNYAANKKLVYSIAGPEGATGVTVSNKGVVKATKNATPGLYDVRVAAVANEKAGFTVTIKVEAPKKNVVSITSDKTDYEVVVYDESVPIEGIKIETNDGTKLGIGDLVWTSSNSKVASLHGGYGYMYISGEKAGKAKITGTAKDGSKKKITLNVTVVDPVRFVYLYGDGVVATGKSTMVNLISYTYSYKLKKAKDFKWTVSPEGQGVTVKNGKVTASKKATAGTYTVRAEAKDSQGAYEEFPVIVTADAAKSIKIEKKDTKITLQRRTETANADYWSREIPITLNGGDAYVNYRVDIENHKVANAYINRDASGQCKLCVVAGDSVGTATIKVVSIDGTKKSVSVKVTVTNPISNLSVTFPEGSSPVLAYSKSMKLVPVFSTENGIEKNANKTLKWTSSNTSVFTVDKNGKVTAKASEGAAIISAVSEQYGLVGEIELVASDLITKAEVLDLDEYTDVNEEGDKIKGGALTLKVKTKQNGEKLLSISHFDAIDTIVDKEGLTFTHTPGILESTGEMFVVAEYVVNKPGTYTATIKLKDGNKIKVTKKITF
ncbi:MAG: hypothetical protein E7288_01770 [Lachnospiraceae bacterium]|nr:hypothetical protein [Lachnospiraceae bacterium]